MNLLRKLSEDELLNLVQKIVCKPGPLSKQDKEELSQINSELVRRGNGKESGGGKET